MVENKIKPCPFCGSNDISEHHDHFVCDHCLASGPLYFHKDILTGFEYGQRDLLISIWNHRGEDPNFVYCEYKKIGE
jgi:ribosomal protein S27AE